MTALEKRLITERYMRLVRENYHILRTDGRARPLKRRRGLRSLEKWLTVIEEVCASLRSRSGKSAARARHDWLIARTITIWVFGEGSEASLQTQLTGPRTLNRRYVDGMMEAAVRAIEEAADEAGLLDGPVGKG